METFEIGAGDADAELFHVGCEFAADVAAIEILEARLRQMIERIGEPHIRRSVPSGGILPSTRKASAKPGAAQSAANSKGLPSASLFDCG